MWSGKLLRNVIHNSPLNSGHSLLDSHGRCVKGLVVQAMDGRGGAVGISDMVWCIRGLSEFQRRYPAVYGALNDIERELIVSDDRVKARADLVLLLRHSGVEMV